MRATVVVNARASGARSHVIGLRDAFDARGVAVDAIDVVPDERALRKHVRRARRAGYDLAIVGGGDGSLATAVDELAHAHTALGVLPFGTGNSFALTLGIGDDVSHALDVIARGRIDYVDLGRANGTHFANFATIGLSAEIAENASHRIKRWIGPLAYVVAAVRPFLRNRPFRARIKARKEIRRVVTRQLVIANGRYFGKQPISPDASVTNGRLALFTTAGGSHAEAVRTYLAMGLGVHDRLPEAVTLASDRIVVKTKPRQRVSIDGNPLGSTPARFDVVPKALRVCVPEDFPHRA